MEEQPKIKDNKKILFAFDLDYTILNKNSDHVILRLLSDEANKFLDEIKKSSDNWANHMQEVYKKMKNENIKINQIKEIVENINFNPGFKELFEFIKSNKDKIDVIIISGANTLFIQWLLEKNNLNDLVSNYYSNWAQFDEELVIKIKGHHTHDCDLCDKSQCKRLILINHLESCDNSNYSKIIFAGDGENDYCPATLLKENDVLFPRKDFPLSNKLYNKGYIKNLKCSHVVWEDGFLIIETLKQFI